MRKIVLVLFLIFSLMFSCLSVQGAWHLEFSQIDTILYPNDPTQQSLYQDVKNLGGDYYVMAYQGKDVDGYISTLTIDNTGDISNFIETWEFDTTKGEYEKIDRVDGDIYLVYYVGGAGTDDSILIFKKFI